jgi:hypothetical protein
MFTARSSTAGKGRSRSIITLPAGFALAKSGATR